MYVHHNYNIIHDSLLTSDIMVCCEEVREEWGGVEVWLLKMGGLVVSEMYMCLSCGFFAHFCRKVN